jgi:preprotein translocase subunit SecE
MISKVEQPKAASSGDIVKYALAILLAAAGVFAFYWFENQWPAVVRTLAVIAGLVAGAVVFLTSFKGVQTREFLSESRFELRKVVWPTRQEAGRATLMVIIAVVILSLLLAGFDVVIQAGVKWLLGR